MRTDNKQSIKKANVNTNINIFYKSNKHSLTYENNLFSFDLLYANYCSRKDSLYKQNVYHKHPNNYELQYVLNGTAVHELSDGKQFTLKKGYFILMPPDTKHKINLESPDFAKLSFSFSLNPKAISQTNFYEIAEKAARNIAIYKAPKIIKTLTQALIECNVKIPDYKNFVLFNILSLVVHIFGIIAENNEIQIKKNYNDQRINDAIKYIEENISATTTVKEVSEHVHLSAKQFTRIFTNTLNISPGDYIKNQRAKLIRNYLINLDYTLEDIAENLGYNDTASLIKFFKRIEGVTPYHYRKQLYIM